jgi:TRAP-type C4-dicarboxylate transport system permease small subunit
MKDTIKLFIKNFEEVICGIFIVAMVAIVITNVFLRYLFNYSLFWAEEVATICFVWAVFVGASATYKHKMDIGIDVLILKTPPRTQMIIRRLVNVLLLIINGYIFYLSMVFTRIAWMKPTAVLGITSGVVNSALIVGFGLITLHTLRFIWQDLQVRKTV